MQAVTISSSYGGWSPLAALRRHQADMASAMERLATGKKINRASDGPADMVAIESLKGDSAAAVEQIKALDRENSHLAAQEGAESVVADLVLELQGLTVSAANTGATSETERKAMQVEADSILQTISYLGATSTYNGQKLLDGWDPSNMGKVTVEDGEGKSTGYSLADLASGGQLSLFSGDMNVAQRVVEAASGSIADSRGSIGADMRSNESRMRALAAEQEGTEGARSLLEDVDVASEISRLVRARTLQQASLFAAAISQHGEGTVLKLLSGAGIDVTA